MPGPPPKPRPQRRRSNAQPGARELPIAGRRSAAPALGRRPGGRAWLRATRTWWAEIWSSPMAAAWLPTDILTLRRLALLVDTVSRPQEAPPATVHSEIRQLEDRFGLSPLARRKLQWEIETAASEEPAELERPPATVRRLRAVDPNVEAG